MRVTVAILVVTVIAVLIAVCYFEPPVFSLALAFVCVVGSGVLAILESDSPEDPPL